MLNITNNQMLEHSFDALSIDGLVSEYRVKQVGIDYKASNEEINLLEINILINYVIETFQNRGDFNEKAITTDWVKAALINIRADEIAKHYIKSAQMAAKKKEGNILSSFLYLKNRKGMYYYGMKFDDVREIMMTALLLSKVVPAIMVTNGKDESVFEADNGKITFPNDQDFIEIDYSDLDNIPEDMSELIGMIQLRNENSEHEFEFRRWEALILASAAIYEFNLFEAGWTRPGSESE